MNNFLQALNPNQRKGSKPRCHLLTHGDTPQVAERLTNLVKPWGEISPTDCWMPQGFDHLEEAQLHNAPQLLDVNTHVKALKSWWLAVAGAQSKTPNWDIASTCTIKGKKGLILVEAKAHDVELRNEEKGKKLKASVTSNSRRNHTRIGGCIQNANLDLADETGLPWSLSRDWNYQMANRFAWSWKLTELGFPIILVYLGFLQAEEMRKKNQLPFANHEEWDRLVKSHSHPLFPVGVWNKPWAIHGQFFIPLIKSIKQPLP